jgi:hypothetical protein
MKIFALLFLLIVPLFALASEFSKLRQQDLTLLKVTSSNSEQEKIKPCSEFAKNKNEIINYLSSASKISGEVAHREFEVYHCSVSGSFKIEQQEYTFTIFAGGLGYVYQPNKSQLILGCRNQCCEKSPSICW